MKNNLPLAYIELSKNNLIHNIKQLKNLAKKGTKFSVAIKGNAYGHGLKEIVQILENQVDYFQVNSIEELASLRKITKKECLLLGYVQKNDLLKAIKLDCVLSVFSLEQLFLIYAMAEMGQGVQKIHIPVDAYLGREGFLLNDLPKVFQEIKKYKHIKLSGIYAHFANIEDTTNFTHAKKQISIFNRAIILAKKSGFKNLRTHISATSGLLVYEKNKGLNSLIRLGIGTYGLWPSKHIKFLYKNKMELKPVLSWKTKVAQIKILPAGSTIGYGLTHMTYDETKIAIIPQGYADGLDRGFSNKGEVLISGSRCKILGRVAMNMCVADITHLADVKIEDEVVIIGKQGKLEITAEDLAKKIDTINYEITTRISAHLPRIII